MFISHFSFRSLMAAPQGAVLIKARAHHSANAIWGAISRQNEAWKCRNTLCISSFRNEVMA
jgi:hypothetical protein